MELHGNALGQWYASLHFLLPAFVPLHTTNLRTLKGNFAIPFPAQFPRTSRNRNSSTKSQFHKTTEDEGEVKETIPKSTRTKRRKVAGHFQAGLEKEKKKIDGGSGSFPIFLSFVYLSTFHFGPSPKGKRSFSFSGNRKRSPSLKRPTTASPSSDILTNGN